MKDSFKCREFESCDNIMFTFIGHNGSFCIMLNAKCIHSVKTKRLHDKKVNELVTKYNLIEI